MTKQKFDVGGMSCAACASGIEKAVKRLDGVETAEVSLLEKSMTVIYDESALSNDKIIATVEKLGYTAAIFGTRENKYADAEKLKKRFFVSLIFLVPLMYLSMFKMFGAPTFGNLSGIGFIIDLVLQFTLATVIIAVNFNFYKSGVRAVKNCSPNMDTLVFLGSFAAYVYSVVVSIMIIFGTLGNTHVYFEAAAMVMTLVDLGKYLEELSKRKTGEEIDKLNKLLPKTVIRLTNGKEETVLTSELSVGDIIVLKNGDYCPIDGCVVKGAAAIDKSAITGESIPEDAEEKYKIVSGSILRSGYLEVRCEKVGGDTLFNKIVETVRSAGASKVPMQRFADRVSAVFVPVVISLAVLTFILQIIINGEAGYAFKCAISVIVISCPCALGLATPVAVMAGTGRAAALGVLFKDGETLQKSASINCVLLDKTATITEGKPKVTGFINLSDKSDGEIFAISSALERFSNHPLALAVTEFCGESDKAVSDYLYVAGKGISAKVDGAIYSLGNFIKPDKYFAGSTTFCLSAGDKILAVFGISDAVKADSKSAICALTRYGIKAVMITGDNALAAKSVAEETGIKDYEYSVLPADKAEYVNKYRASGYRVAFVGDGINDSPAIKSADVGIAVGGGTDIAIESADAVIAGGSLTKISDLIRIGKKTVRIIKENLFWAFFYNVMMIPIAAGALAFPGLKFEPWMAAACMSVSSLFVVLNALRLNAYGKTKNKKGDIFMELKVEGMMCEHCKKRVKEAVESVSGVEKADVDLKKKTVRVYGEADLNEVKSAIIKAGYDVL